MMKAEVRMTEVGRHEDGVDNCLGLHYHLPRWYASHGYSLKELPA
jgi:hypothetical protein